MKNPDLLTVITARMSSQRCPGKVLADIEGKPLLYHQIQRIKTGLGGRITVATTTNPEDDKIENVARAAGVSVTRHHKANEGDVVSLVHKAVDKVKPGYVFPFPADIPFLATEIVQRSLDVMRRQKANAFLWYMPPQAEWPVYGAREFPLSLTAWRLINAAARGDEREHVRLWFDRNRGSVGRVIYHEAPDNIYFRGKYRLEVDTPQDLAVVRGIAAKIGMQQPVKDVVLFLDKNPHIAMLNWSIKEKTGPSASFNPADYKKWWQHMKAEGAYSWDNQVVRFTGSKGIPKFCEANRCLLGWGSNGNLHTPKGDIIAHALRLVCKCEDVTSNWKPAIRRKGRQR